MKTIGKFTSFGHEFTVKIRTMETNSNYNTFCHVFHEKEKMALIGFTFKDGTPKDQIMVWAKKSIAQLQSEELVNDIYTHCKPKTSKERWPELDDIAFIIANKTTALINELSKAVSSENPYKAQCILEMVIEKLEKAV